MQLEFIDWIVILLFGILTLVVGVWFSKRAGTSMEEYFVAGRTLPWWLAGTSIAATWFATDAPLLASSLVRQYGIYANWLWWYEGAGVIMMVFFFAKLWRRANIITDAEFIELRYSGKPASILRGFTAIYHGLLRNLIIMGWVMLAMMKFSKVLLGLDPIITLAICGALALGYTIASGMWGVVVTDLIQFIAGMIGTTALAGIVIYELGGPVEMAAQVSAISTNPGTLDLFPNPAHLSSVEVLSFFCLIFILWITRGQGDGYTVQRLFATKDEKQSMLAALWFSIAGIVLMTWPWVVVGLGSLVILPIATASPELLADPELAYPMMIAKLLPVGLKGLLVASFLAAFMSTMDTHLCWGGSYLVNDIYRRFIKPDEDEKHYVLISRISMVLLTLLAVMTAWQLDSIERAWIYLIQISGGVGVIILLRWYWWRINAWAEIAAMTTSVVIANGFLIIQGVEFTGLIPESILDDLMLFYGNEYDMARAVFILLVATFVGISVALLTPADSEDKLKSFYKVVRPGGWWGPIAAQLPEIKTDFKAGTSWLGWFMGTLFLYGELLGLGYVLTGKTIMGTVLMVLALFGGAGALYLTKRSSSLDTKP